MSNKLPTITETNQNIFFSNYFPFYKTVKFYTE